MLKPLSLAKWGVAVLLLSSLSSCEDILEQYFPKPNPTPPPTTPTFPPLGLDIPFYALSGGTKLDAYSTKDPATRTASVSITGLQSGERILAMDFRPGTGQLYGVSSGSRIYVINQNTGRAHAIGSGAFTPALGGNVVSFDFNPTVDRIRLVTSTGQNLRLHPETATVAATDGSINGATGATVAGVAYTNNVAGAAATSLYAINTQNQQLYLVNPPNNGTLVSVGSLNLPVSGDGGFDIDAKTGTALGLYSVNGSPTLFTVDLTTGAARTLASYSTSLNYTGLAIPTRPVAYIATNVAGDFTTLSIIDPTDSNSVSTKNVTGIGGGSAIGLDFRPATGQLYTIINKGSLGSSNLYTIDLGTGTATFVAVMNIRVIFTGSFDFDPVTDMIRVVGVSGQNLRVDPTTGFTTEDSPIGIPVGINRPGVKTLAHDNNFVGATTSNLYGTDVSINLVSKLYQVTPIVPGNLKEIGNVTADVRHMDIGGTSNTAYILVNVVNNVLQLNTLNLSTGERTFARTLNIPGLDQSNELPSGFALGLGF
ncbi:DUF4394 domain-containing protein [Hymenobacter sp. BT188]|uniref:DUF4394 domain-containing protein n=1 Tax=Hymenobacter sp. BT188 TaxID=2763504 RepID=UPI0016510BE9|nr:DUF4394 domain-containing protein [Hymenobacter sp. BT188]MBC6605897.1 DUF4394 domain-containing protein [Hymenobacter sp. BT188]